MENAVANCDHSRICTLNWVNFGLQTTKNWIERAAMRLGIATHFSLNVPVIVFTYDSSQTGDRAFSTCDV